MKYTNLRTIASRLGLSTATISRACHGDPRVRPATAKRVLAAVKAAGYQFDPVVSAGMSKIRQGGFYRETLAWCGDAPASQLPWLKTLFRSAEEFGARLGYSIDYFHFDRPEPIRLRRLTSIWKARGIRGVILGPFLTGHAGLPFPWENLAWVRIGDFPQQPTLHSVGRDYETDIQTALRWLREKGCHRPCFLIASKTRHLFQSPMLQASLLHYHNHPSPPPDPFHELDPGQPEKWNAWLKANRPDSLVLPSFLGKRHLRMIGPGRSLPTVFLSPPGPTTPPVSAFFTARYPVIGQATVNLLHRLLNNREFGIPAYKQSVALDSPMTESGSPPPKKTAAARAAVV